MEHEREWTLEFFVDDGGRSPIEDFLDSLDPRTRARFRWSMEQLRVRNVRAHEPLVRHLEGALWELRESSAGNIFRIVYLFFTGRRIVFLHGFQKKSQKTPARELATARERHRVFLEREGGV